MESILQWLKKGQVSFGGYYYWKKNDTDGLFVMAYLFGKSVRLQCTDAEKMFQSFCDGEGFQYGEYKGRGHCYCMVVRLEV